MVKHNSSIEINACNKPSNYIQNWILMGGKQWTHKPKYAFLEKYFNQDFHCDNCIYFDAALHISIQLQHFTTYTGI